MMGPLDDDNTLPPSEAADDASAVAAPSLSEGRQGEAAIITATSADGSNDNGDDATTTKTPTSNIHLAAANNTDGSSPLMSYFDDNDDNDDSEEGESLSEFMTPRGGEENCEFLTPRGDADEVVVDDDGAPALVTEGDSRDAESERGIIMNGEAGKEGGAGGGSPMTQQQKRPQERSESSSFTPSADGGCNNTNDEEVTNNTSQLHGDVNNNVDTSKDQGAVERAEEENIDSQMGYSGADSNNDGREETNEQNPNAVDKSSSSPPSDDSTASKEKDESSAKEEEGDDGNNESSNNDRTYSRASKSLIVEAERQAAIAAAITANMSSSASPSVAALAARAAAAGSNGRSSNLPPAPPPRDDNYNSPTMVALPPIVPPPPHPLERRQQQLPFARRRRNVVMMQPVRFEDVKIAFCELLIPRQLDGDEEKDAAKADKPVAEEKGEGGVEKAKEREESEEGNDKGFSELETTKDDAKDGDATSSDSEKKETSQQEKYAEGEGAWAKAADEASSAMDPTITTTTTTPTTQQTTTIPDSFLRFLLLVARVPIIVEEHKKQQTSPPNKRGQVVDRAGEEAAASGKGREEDEGPKRDPKATMAAAKRALEILRLAQTAYDGISDRQEKRSIPNNDDSVTQLKDYRSSDDGDGKVDFVGDSTTAFFKACAGELVETEECGERNVVANDAVRGVMCDGVAIGNGVGRFNDTTSPPRPSMSMMSKPQLSTPSSAFSASTSTSATGTTLTAASSMASAVFSNVMSKMIVTKKQGSFYGDISKKLGVVTSQQGAGGGEQQQKQRPASSPQQRASSSLISLNSSSLPPPPKHLTDYEITINQEMLGLTVENVLERTIIRTLLPDGAARHAGAQVGSLIAKVGNVETSNLTHFETIDELRRSSRPVKLTLRHIGGNILRRAREEMGRLIRGKGVLSSSSTAMLDERSGDVANVKDNNKPWRKESSASGRQSSATGGGGHNDETFDLILSDRWPSKTGSGNRTLTIGSSGSEMMSSTLTAPPPPTMVMTRAETTHKAGQDLIGILALLVVGLEKELSALNDDNNSNNSEEDQQQKRKQQSQQHQSTKEIKEAIDITSKTLLDYARGHPDVAERQSRSPGSGNRQQQQQQQQHGGSTFYPVPPGRVQSKKHTPPPPPAAGRGGRGGRGRGGGAKSSPSINNSPLLRIGDALSRTRSFLVESLSTTATTLRWEIIDYLCTVLDIDTEMELSEREDSKSITGGGEGKGGEGNAASGGGGGSPTNDLGSAGNILKLIVLNCSTSEEEEGLSSSSSSNELGSSDGDLESSSSSSSSPAEEQSSQPPQRQPQRQHYPGNCFLSVVHRLAASKSTSARIAACSLGPILWSHLDFPRQLQLRGVITRALHDVEVMVRKSTATVLHEIAELVFDRRAVPWLVLMCERSMTDPEPQLRAAAMTLTWHLAEHLPNAFLGDARKGSRSIRRLPPRDSPTFMDVYLLQCKLLPVANNLAEDRVASVRLSVAAQCDRLCNALGEHWFSVIIDLLQALLSDSDERVRSEAILCMPRLVESVIVGSSSIGQGNSVTVLESLLPLALKIQKDTSTLVRSSLATATGELLIFLVGLGGESGGSSSIEPPHSPGRGSSSGISPRGAAYEQHKKHVDDTLIPILQQLLQDSDPEVTTASLRAVTNASRSGTARDTTSTHIPSCSHHKFNDSAAPTPPSPGGGTIDDDLISLSSHQSHQSHASYERTKPVFIPVLSEEQVLRLLPTLSNLATSSQWRVRQSAVEIVPALMGCTKRNETRHEISKLCLGLMNDKVDAVRKTAAECLCLGGSSLARHGEDDGGEWIMKTVVPHLRTCSASEDSKQRLLSLKMIEIIITNGLCPSTSIHHVVETAAAAPSSPSSPRDDESTATGSSSSSVVVETPLRTILNIAASHTSDKVANVRLNVGRTFGSIMSLLDVPDVDFAVATLERQLEEETSRDGEDPGDPDVIYFAQQAISVSQPFRRTWSNTSC